MNDGLLVRASSASAICVAICQRFVEGDGPTRDRSASVALDGSMTRKDFPSCPARLPADPARRCARCSDVQGGEDLGFTLEPREAFRIAAIVCGQDFDRDLTLQTESLAR